MRRITLKLMRAAATGALLAASVHLATPLTAAEVALDTSTLARVVGATETYASPATTIFTSSDTVPATAAAAAKLLAADGWLVYEDPFSSRAEIPNQRQMTLKKGRQGLSVLVTLAPAQGNRTSVSYTANPIADDLPFPADATEIRYAPDRPHLALVTATPLDASLAFFRDEMAARGWVGWSRKDNRKATAGEDTSEPNPKGKFAFFVREGEGRLGGPLMLQLQSRDDGRLGVTLERVPEKLLSLLVARDDAADAPAAPETAAPANPDPVFDSLAGEIMDQVRKATGEALAGIGKPPAPARSDTPAAGPATRLAPMSRSAAPFPLPETAEDIDVDGARGSVAFVSRSDVRSVAGFYREAMRADGWTSERSVINKAHMVVLRFTKNGKDLSLTVMAFGDKTRVDASGSALETQDTQAGMAGAAPADAEPAAVTELAVEERSGLPVPAPHSLSGSEKSLFRVSAHASVTAPLASVRAFYGRELAARGWKEKDGAVATAERADIAYTTPDGPALLTLLRKNGETFVTLTLRKQQEAEKAGLLPPAGRTRLLFGNMLEQEAVLTIGKHTVKVGAGLGAKKPDGPTLDLAPGKYTYTLRVPGQTAHTDAIEVASGDLWGLMVGPGGVLALPMY